MSANYHQCPLAVFALSNGGGQNFLVSKANLEIRVGVDKSTFIHWNEIDVAAFYLNLKSVTDLNVG